jgi:NTP pyrophosphatase (non-canonical NTP hydrolase)
MPIYHDEHAMDWIRGTGSQSDELLLKVINEEVIELVEAIYEYTKSPGWNYSKKDLLKEMCDVIFTIAVFCETKNWDLEGAFDEVCNSNLSKLTDGVILRREDGKILKGPNYVEADMNPYI